MPQAAAIAINDGQGVPVLNTFTPIGKDSNGVYWFEQTTPTPSTFLETKRIGIQVRRRYSQIGKLENASVVTLSIALPKAETLGNNSQGLVPPPTRAYETTVRLTFSLPERGALQDRKDIRSFAANLLGNAAVVQACLDNMAPVY